MKGSINERPWRVRARKNLVLKGSIKFRWVLLSFDGRFLAGMGWGRFKLRWMLLSDQWLLLSMSCL